MYRDVVRPSDRAVPITVVIACQAGGPAPVDVFDSRTGLKIKDGPDVCSSSVIGCGTVGDSEVLGVVGGS